MEIFKSKIAVTGIYGRNEKNFLIWKILCVVAVQVPVCFLNGLISNFMHRAEKSSGLTNKGQSRGLGSLQQTGNCGLQVYFIVINLSLYLPKGECGWVFLLALHI